VFDTGDPFALTIYNKVERGVLRMASAGLVPVEWNKEALPPVLLKSRMREASIVDIGSNDDALAVALYNDNGDLCNLSGQSIAHSAMPLKDWDELDRSGELERLKTDNFPLFKRKFQE